MTLRKRILILSGAAFLLGGGLRGAVAGFSPGVATFARLLAVGLGSGIAVALVEETVMRGALQTAVQRESGPWAAVALITPLFAVMLTVELVDVTFALDSVPAVVAVTRDPFLAYTSNIFAVLGLRALYFVVENVIERCWLLPYALAGLLAFIGAKMLLAKIYEVPLSVSLIVIALALVGGVLGSWLYPRPAAR